MSAVDYGEYQRAVRLMEDDTARGLGQPVRLIRTLVAREIGVSPGTLENLHRERIKGVRSWLMTKLRAAVLADLQREIEAHQHELATIALHPGCALAGAVQEVDAGLSRLKSMAAELRS